MLALRALSATDQAAPCRPLPGSFARASFRPPPRFIPFFSRALTMVAAAGLSVGCATESPAPEAVHERAASTLAWPDEGEETELLEARLEGLGPGEAWSATRARTTLPEITLPGSWEGELPCADCAEIGMRLTLEASGVFFLEEIYRGVPEARRLEGDTVFQSMGRWFVVGEDDPAVAAGQVRLLAGEGGALPLRLAGTGEDPRFLRPMEGGALRVLPRDPALEEGGRGETNNPREQSETSPETNTQREQNPILRPVASPSTPFSPGGRYQARGGFAYFADAATFTECEGGVLLPVAMEGGYLNLERAYLNSGIEPGSNLPVFVRGGIQAREPADPATGQSQAWFLVLGEADLAPEGFGDRGCPALEVRDAFQRGDPWVLEAWRTPGAEPRAPLEAFQLPEGSPGDVPSFQWDGSEGRLTGSGGCNRFMGPAGLRGTQLMAGGLATTMRYCDGVMEVEDFFLRLLSGSPSMALGPDGTLHLHDGPFLAARLVRSGSASASL